MILQLMILQLYILPMEISMTLPKLLKVLLISCHNLVQEKKYHIFELHLNGKYCQKSYKLKNLEMGNFLFFFKK